MAVTRATVGCHCSHVHTTWHVRRDRGRGKTSQQQRQHGEYRNQTPDERNRHVNECGDERRLDQGRSRPPDLLTMSAVAFAAAAASRLRTDNDQRRDVGQAGLGRGASCRHSTRCGMCSPAREDSALLSFVPGPGFAASLPRSVIPGARGAILRQVSVDEQRDGIRRLPPLAVFGLRSPVLLTPSCRQARGDECAPG